MTIATFNVNGIRARMDLLREWLTNSGPDIVALQEIKVDTTIFPHEALESTGYTAYVHGQKGFNGVAFLSKIPLEDVEAGMPESDFNNDARTISCIANGVKIINTYVPNGTKVGTEKFAYKLAWMESFERMIRERHSQSDPMIWLGDVNVAPTPLDVFESEKHLGGIGHHPEEFDRLARIVDFGWTDLYRKFDSENPAYTFWDFRLPRAFDRDLGWRIDHIYATPSITELARSVTVDREPRGLIKPSDHTAVILQVDL